MPGFLAYANRLSRLADTSSALPLASWRKACKASLDGEPSRVLRMSSDLARLRDLGIYFTGAKLARRVADYVKPSLSSGAVYLDPACGAGDLLLGIARRLPIGSSLSTTLTAWGRQLAGCDTSLAFVRTTKARLKLLAMLRCGVSRGDLSTSVDDLFPMVAQGDALSDASIYRKADAILLNPPFCAMKAPHSCLWAAGRINASALFLEAAVVAAKPGTAIVAVLPDVLRAGVRYARWRDQLERKARLVSVAPYGIFDSQTDVDVFLLSMIAQASVPKSKLASWQSTFMSYEKKTLGDMFHLHVGPVVPHRHRKSGRIYRYIHARMLSSWRVVKRISERRRFSGSAFSPPFVVVRRTSKPDDRKRAVATIIDGKQKVAVENHLIILMPKDGTLRTCKLLLKRLQSVKTDKWLNRKIRCRHLTISALSEMPWWRTP